MTYQLGDKVTLEGVLHSYFEVAGITHDKLKICGDFSEDASGPIDERWVNIHLVSPYITCERPPKGLSPRKFLDEDRATQIKDAIIRYVESDNNEAIPLAWISEYNEIQARLKEGKGKLY